MTDHTYTPLELTFLQPASWRGVPFEVLNVQQTLTPSTVLHTYPYKAYPVVEWIGYGTQKYTVSGYVSSSVFLNLSDSAQKDLPALTKAVQNLYGPGILILPQTGAVTATLVDCAFAMAYDSIGYISIQFNFVLTDPKQNSSAPMVQMASTDTQATLFGYSVSGLSAAVSDFSNDMLQGLQIAGAVFAAAVGFTDIVVGVIGDAAAVAGATKGLGLFVPDVSFGVFGDGNLTAPPAVLSTLPTALTTSEIVAQGTALMLATAALARAATASDIVTLHSAAVAGNVALMASTAALVMTDVAAAITDPADQLVAYQQLAAYSTDNLAVGAQIMAAMLRRNALCALSQAVASYNPTSRDDALQVLAAVTPLYDAEIVYSANMFDGDSYNAMRALKQGVVADMTTRGSNLPELVDIGFATALPTCIISQICYQTGSRSDEVVRRNAPFNPLWASPTLELLSY